MSADKDRPRRRLSRQLTKFGAVFSILVICTLILSVSARATTPMEQGFLDFSFGSTVRTYPTDGRPESKLWWNDGIWWGNLYNPQTDQYEIYRLDWATQNWTSTGVGTDNRPDSRADVLWDETYQKLYIASHSKLENPSRVTGPENWGKLYRFSYDSTGKIYTLDYGFYNAPVNEDKTRTLVLDKDSTGRLWVTYVSREINSSTYQVYINTLKGDGSNEALWGIPFVLPFSQATVDLVDISAIIAFTDNEGPKVGVMWTNNLDGKFYFASHLDSSPSPSAGWVLETGLNVPYPSNDHINFAKTSTGEVFAAIKTLATGPNDPLIGLVARDRDGVFSFHPISNVLSNDTRPIVIVDEGSPSSGDEYVYVFMDSDPSAGVICSSEAQIVTPLSNISFELRPCGDPGLAGATQVLADHVYHPTIENATSTKQTLNSTTDIVLLATDDLSGHVYMHAVIHDPPPHVTSRLPIPGSKLYTGSVKLQVVFSEQVDPATINNNSFKVSSNQGPINGVVSYSIASQTATFIPSTSLVGLQNLTVNLSTEISDLSGQSLLNTPLSWDYLLQDITPIYLPIMNQAVTP